MNNSDFSLRSDVSKKISNVRAIFSIKKRAKKLMIYWRFFNQNCPRQSNLLLPLIYLLIVNFFPIFTIFSQKICNMTPIRFFIPYFIPIPFIESKEELKGKKINFLLHFNLY